jgi:hypothetical protein
MRLVQNPGQVSTSAFRSALNLQIVVQELLDGSGGRFILGGGHGGAPLGVRDVEHHHPAMTAPFRRLVEPSPHCSSTFRIDPVIRGVRLSLILSNH